MRLASTCVITLLALSVSAATLEAHECVARGFDPVTLKCSTCKHLETFVSASEPIAQECVSCCNVAADAGERDSVAKCVIEYDQRWIQGTPLEVFVSKTLPTYAGRVSARHRTNSVPRALLYSQTDDAKPIETVNIAGWEAGLIAEFLSRKLSQ
jgi:hypothetical protein